MLGNRLGLSLPRKSVVRLTDNLDMTILVDWDVKPQKKKQTPKNDPLAFKGLLLTYYFMDDLSHLMTKPTK